MLGIIITIIIVLFIYIYSIFYFANCNKKLNIDISFHEDRININELCIFKINIINQKFLILPIIKLHIYIPKEIIIIDKHDVDSIEVDDFYTYNYTTSLLSFQKSSKNINMKALKRGKYTLNFSYSISDLLGLKTIKYNCKKQASIIVHPEASNIDNILEHSTSFNGQYFVKRWILPDNIFYSGVRKYTPIDNFKDIDWIATAKFSELYVKKYDYTSDPSIMIYLDIYSPYKSNLNDSIYIEKSINLATSLIYIAYNYRIPVGFGTNADVNNLENNLIKNNHGIANIINILDMLASMNYKSYYTIRDFFDKNYKFLADGNTVILIKYMMTDYIELLIKNFNKDNINVVLFLYEKTHYKKPNCQIIYFKEG